MFDVGTEGSETIPPRRNTDIDDPCASKTVHMNGHPVSWSNSSDKAPNGMTGPKYADLNHQIRSRFVVSMNQIPIYGTRTYRATRFQIR